MRILLLLLLSTASLAQKAPNIIYMMSDDHDADAISAYSKRLIHTPNIDRIAKEGMRFTNAFVGNSICGPARATLLTGQHAHKNGIKDNATRFDSSRQTLPKILQAAGYQTAIIGKWHLISHPTGFDYWKVLPGQGIYIDPSFIEMPGKTIPHQGYATEIITEETISWLERRDKSKPFALFMHHKAPHRNFFPQLKYLEEFSKKQFPEPSTLYADTVNRGSAWRMHTMSILRDMDLCSDLKVDPAYLISIPEYKPGQDQIDFYNNMMSRLPEEKKNRYKEIYSERGKILQQLQPKGKELLKYKFQWYLQDFLACVASVDESVGRITEYLEKENLTDNTALIYTSDQGFFLGENGWFDKRFAYDVSMQVPLLVKWPGHVKPGSVSNALVQNIDFAPTMLDIARVAVPEWMQGLSLKPVITAQQKLFLRDNLYYHYYEYNGTHTVIPHLAIRGYRYKLIYFYTVNEWELYDLKNDPQEQKNLIRSPIHQKTFQQMKAELLNLRNQYDDHQEAGELD